MADVGEEEEYESDPEQVKLSLKMRRRREASDDEEDDDGGDDARGREKGIDSRVFDCESDGQGAAAEYDDEEYDLEEEEEDLLEEVEEEEEEFRGGCGDSEARSLGAQVVGEDLVGGLIEENLTSLGEKRENEQTDGDGVYVGGNVDQFGDNANGREGEEGQGQEEKKENEPFAVPTAGAFYMHDDRFRDGAVGRHRRTTGMKKLWELKDNKKWGHDKFEEMTMQERHQYEGRRVARGRNRARGSSRGEDRGYLRGNRPKEYDNNHQKNAPKSVRGRGPRRYQASTKNNIEARAQSKQPVKSVEKTSHPSSGRASSATSTSESSQVPARKNIFASSLNSASPPFYPSGSSNKEINSTQKRDAQMGQINRSTRPPVTGENYAISQSNMRGKSVSDSLGMDKLYIDDSISSLAGKLIHNLPLPNSGPAFINPTQPPQTRDKGRSPTPLGQVAYQPVPPHNQINRVPSPNQVNAFQPAPVQNRPQPTSGQQLGSRSASGSQASSPPKASGLVHSLESTELELESNNPKMALVGKGKASMQSSGMSSFPFAGAQVMGASGSIGGNHGDQNFPGTPTFLPVMQFAGQHPGGIGVPAVGMAFPGYVAQPNGMGNSEMTWLPVLAGAAGALGATGGLGATYCSPYITMDSAYHARTSGQTSSLATASSKDSNTNKPGNEVKPSQRPELANDELGQRQNKARRYTEMKFDQ